MKRLLQIAAVIAAICSDSVLGQSSNSLTQGLIAYYPFSGNAQDASGSGNNGNAMNVVYGVDRNGQAGAAADFSSSNAWVEVPTLNAMAYTPVTYSAWFKLNSYPTAGERRWDGYFIMHLLGRDVSGAFNQGELNLANPGPDNMVTYYTGTSGIVGFHADTNVWTHVTFTIDGSNQATFYKNGQLVNSVIFDATQSDVIPFRIGASAALTDYRLGWKGLIDDVRIYNRALSSNEVAQLYLAEAPLSVAPPSFVTQPNSATALVGSNVTFTAGAIGGMPMVYQWLLNSAPISGATNSTYTVINPQLTDDGSSYAVVVTNSYGTATSDVAVLTVGNAPSITTQPASQTVTQGNPATFSVLATGTVPLTYQWSKDGQPIVGATDSSYTVANTQPVNIGDYQVVISNNFGVITSSAANLSIQGYPDAIWKGIVAYYPFSGNPTDASGNGNDGSPNNVVFDTDRFGQPNAAADFSLGNAYVDVPTLQTMAYTPVTYSLWFNVKDFSQPGEQRPDDSMAVMTLIGRELTASFHEGALCLYTQQPTATNEIIYYTGENDVPSGITPALNQWIHLTFTIDSSNHATYYWNGRLLKSVLFTAPQDDVLPFRIGASASFNDYRLSFRGLIDDVRVYNRALSADEVAQLYLSESPLPAPWLDIRRDSSGNLVVKWPVVSGFGLETVSNLGSSWAPVLVSPVTNGGTATLTQPASEGQLFFRLRKP